jgi:hypothetical protein
MQNWWLRPLNRRRPGRPAHVSPGLLDLLRLPHGAGPKGGGMLDILHVRYPSGLDIHYPEGHPDLGGRSPEEMYRATEQTRCMSGQPALGVWLSSYDASGRLNYVWWGLVPLHVVSHGKDGEIVPDDEPR